MDKRKSRKKSKKKSRKKGKPKEAVTEQPKPKEKPPVTDFRDREYPEIERTKDMNDAILDGFIQVVNTPQPLLVRVSGLKKEPLFVNGKELERNKIYKVVEKR